ncbi:dihydrofolate reductase family protein [Dactylosporangium sp. NPDC049742]|uniref:dihydrofolate reductase family protein n=1 Tax=Dactylosporangium sp. NPDC049742 TaxID=3154737 RepID=UPI003422C630
MAKIVAQCFMSVDGVVESPEQWHFPYYDTAMESAVAAQLHQADTLLLGRATYEVFAGHWPHQGNDVLFAKRLNSLPKLVVSTTLNTVEWQNSTLIRDIGQLATVASASDGHITVSGSATLVRSLLDHDLLDELELLVHPLVVGHGARLFDNGGKHRPLNLIRSTTFDTGVLHLVYEPV